MKKGWKITLISLGSVIGLVLVVVVVAMWLIFTPSKLTSIVNSLAGKYLSCQATFESVDLTLWRTFPDAGLTVRGVDVINPVSGSPSDTVAHINKVVVGVNVKKYLKEKEIVVNKVIVSGVDALLFTTADGISNYDIFPQSDSASTDDTTSSPFSLDSLPSIKLDVLQISDFSARYIDEGSATTASLEGLSTSVKLELSDGLADAKMALCVDTLFASLADSAGNETVRAKLHDVRLKLSGSGNLDNVSGKLKLVCEKGALALDSGEMVNTELMHSTATLLQLSADVKADMKDMAARFANGKLKLDRYALLFSGEAHLPVEERPMSVDAKLETDGAWQVAELLKIVPKQYVGFVDGTSLDAKVLLQATAVGELTDSTMPLIDAKAKLTDGRYYNPSLLPYDIKKINTGISAHLDLGNNGKSNVVIEDFSAATRGTTINLRGSADDLLGNMRVQASLKGSLPIEDVMPMLPDSLNIKAMGKAKIAGNVAFLMSDIEKMNLERIKANITVGLTDLDVAIDSMLASAPSLQVAVGMPAVKHKESVADLTVTGSNLAMNMPGINGTLQQPDISIGINNLLKQQIAASFDVAVGETEANLDSMMVSVDALKLSGSLRLDSTQSNPLRRFNPVADIDMNSAVLYMPELPDAIRLTQFALRYDSSTCDLSTAEMRIGHSDFQLYGKVENLEPWLEHRELLRADLNLTSSYADVDQLMNMFSGMGTDADSLEQMREEDDVPPEANPFIVPLDVDLTLNTHIKRSVAFENVLSDVAGAVTIRDGVVVLDQMGFVSKAATMQLTALYKSPRPNNLFVALDFHLLDIEIKELLEMIPTVDTLVPMLAAFDGNANFHLAGESFLDARYQPKMSSLLGSAAISGRDLTVMDNSTISQIAKLMQFKSWKDKDDKIKIDSIDVELTCLRKEIEVYPFLLNIGKYSLCASGKHTLDNQCGYHLELLKNPLLGRVGVDVRGNLSKPQVSLGQVRYADLYKPEKQGVVEKRTLELKRMIKEALENNVR